MFNMVDKFKFLNWMKIWQQDKNSSSGDVNANDYGIRRHHGDHHGRQPVIRYGKKGWTSHWNLLHLERKINSHKKDGDCRFPEHQQQQRQKISKSNNISSEKNHLPPAGIKDHRTQQRNARSSSLDLNDKDDRDTAAFRSEVGDISPNAAVDYQQHRSSLKNRVLPVTTRDSIDYTIDDSIDEDGDDIAALSTSRQKLDNYKLRAASLPVKRLSFAKIQSPESPKSPRDQTKWKKLLSYSRTGSPRSPSCFHAPDWSDQLTDRSAMHQKGSFSTMGSPWNSQAGGQRPPSNRRASFKSSYKQGQWITTDSEFVVLEL